MLFKLYNYQYNICNQKNGPQNKDSSKIFVWFVWKTRFHFFLKFESDKNCHLHVNGRGLQGIFPSPLTVFTISSHAEYVKRESIVIAWLKKTFFLLLMIVHVSYILELKTRKKIPVCLPVCLSACLSVCLPVCMSVCPSVCVCLSVRLFKNLTGCTIIFEGVSAFKQNLVGVFYI